MKTPNNQNVTTVSNVLAHLNWNQQKRADLIRLFHPAKVTFVEKLDAQETSSLINTCDVALLHRKIDDRFLSSPTLRWVHMDRSGIDDMATPQLAHSQFQVTTSSGRSAPVLAEHALFFMLNFCYASRQFIRAQRFHCWGIKYQHSLRGLNGKRIAIIGYGETAKALVELCKVMSMDIRVYRRKPSSCPSAVKRMMSAEAGDKLIDCLDGCDIVAICASLNDTSYKMIGSQELSCMNPGALLINVARHQLVDEAALIDALKSGQLGGAGLDVTDPREPLLPWDRLWFAPNLHITPHVTPQMPDRTGRTLDLLEQNISRYKSGLKLHQRYELEDVFTQPEYTQSTLGVLAYKIWRTCLWSVSS